MVFSLSVWKGLPLVKVIVEKTFAIHRKSAKTMKFFSYVAFVVYNIS